MFPETLICVEFKSSVLRELLVKEAVKVEGVRCFEAGTNGETSEILAHFKQGEDKKEAIIIFQSNGIEGYKKAKYLKDFHPDVIRIGVSLPRPHRVIPPPGLDGHIEMGKVRELSSVIQVALDGRLESRPVYGRITKTGVNPAEEEAVIYAKAG